jgi:hypothetical protein
MLGGKGKMKTKEEILKMSQEELQKYKWDDDLNIQKKEDTNKNCFYCSDCSYCSDCFYCSDCSNCSDCSYCRNIKVKSQYMICNVQLTKEEYENKIKELNK